MVEAFPVVEGVGDPAVSLVAVPGTDSAEVESVYSSSGTAEVDTLVSWDEPVVVGVAGVAGEDPEMGNPAVLQAVRNSVCRRSEHGD